MISTRIRSRIPGCPLRRAAPPSPALALLRALALAFALLSSGAAKAQHEAVQISPVNTTRAVENGAAVKGTITVTNPTGATVLVKVFPTDFMLTPPGRLEVLPSGSLPMSSAPWIRLGRQTLTLAPLSSTTVHYRVKVPSDAKPGTHWSAIMFRSVGTPPKTGSHSGIAFQVIAQDAFVVYLNVGLTKPAASIQQLSLDPAPKQGHPAFRLVLQNTGNTVLHFEGRIEARRISGTLVHTYRVSRTASLPGAARDLSIPTNPALKPGTYLLTCLLHDGTPTVITAQRQVTVP